MFVVICYTAIEKWTKYECCSFGCLGPEIRQILKWRLGCRKLAGEVFNMNTTGGLKGAGLSRGRGWAVLQPRWRPQSLSSGAWTLGWSFTVDQSLCIVPPWPVIGCRLPPGSAHGLGQGDFLQGNVILRLDSQLRVTGNMFLVVQHMMLHCELFKCRDCIFFISIFPSASIVPSTDRVCKTNFGKLTWLKHL